MPEQESELFWDSTYAIVMSLMTHYPESKLEEVGLEQLSQMVQTLPGFMDDPALVNDQLLLDILTVWYEEAITL